MQATTSRSTSRFVVPGVWISGLLLGVMLLDLAMALKAAEWTEGLGILGAVVLGGFLLGMAMSFSRWSGLFPILHSLVTGTVWVLIWVSRIPEVPAGLNSSERIAFIGQSLWSWMLLLFSNEPARSNLVFVLELSLLLWWLGYLSAWAVFREGKVWRAIVPIGLVMLVNLYFGPPDLGFYFAVYVVCALLLAVRTHLAEREIEWRIDRIRYPEDIQLDFMRDGLIFAVVVLLLAVLMPSVGGEGGTLSTAVAPLREPWQEVQREWGRLFSSLNYQGAAVGRPAFTDSLTLGGPRDLGDTVIMDVRSNAGRYWRAVSYDTFTGKRWLDSDNSVQQVDFGHHVRTPEFEARQEVTQTITTFYPGGNVIMAAPQPLRVSLKADATIGVIEPGEGGVSPLAEVSMLHRRGDVLRPGDTYLVVSSLSTATIEDLQEAGEDYPEWVRERYLEVSPDTTSRVVDLAKEITAGAATPFEKAVALETYLRNIPYNDQIPAPPPNVNAVDYFLFDVRQGYCDYYASAFAMMARSLGIPARVSAGYSQGEYVPELGAYRVREYNGHSWPEVFFPGYGWVEFEPTASEQVINRTNRPDDQQDAAAAPVDPNERLEDEDQFGPSPELGEGEGGPVPENQQAALAGSNWWIGIVAMLALVAGAAVLLLRPSRKQQRRALLDPQFTIKLYGRLVQWAARLRLPILSSQTPNEQAAVLYRAVPEGKTAILSITDLYVQDLYSPYDPDERKAADVASAWGSLQPVLRRAWLKGRLGPVAHPLARFKRPKPDQSNE